MIYEFQATEARVEDSLIIPTMPMLHLAKDRYLLLYPMFRLFIHYYTLQKARRLQNVVPVVVRQIKDCPDEEFTLFGMQTQIVRNINTLIEIITDVLITLQLSIVGMVIDYEVQSTKAMYNIQDHTGDIKAIWWLETDKVCTLSNHQSNSN